MIYNKKIFVQDGEVKSKIHNIINGLQKGTVIAPILFSISNHYSKLT